MLSNSNFSLISVDTRLYDFLSNCFSNSDSLIKSLDWLDHLNCLSLIEADCLVPCFNLRLNNFYFLCYCDSFIECSHFRLFNLDGIAFILGNKRCDLYIYLWLNNLNGFISDIISTKADIGHLNFSALEFSDSLCSHSLVLENNRLYDFSYSGCDSLCEVLSSGWGNHE